MGGVNVSAASTAFTTTDQIVNFYVDSLTATSGKFRVNYEDVEQVTDHDMDAIAIYEYRGRSNSIGVGCDSDLRICCR